MSAPNKFGAQPLTGKKGSVVEPTTVVEDVDATPCQPYYLVDDAGILDGIPRESEVLVVGDEAFELSEDEGPFVVKPNQVYRIINLDRHNLLCLWVYVRPPFDPNDVHLASSR